MNSLCVFINVEESKVIVYDDQSDAPGREDRIVDCFKFCGHESELIDFLFGFVQKIISGFRIQKGELDVVSGFVQIPFCFAGDMDSIVHLLRLARMSAIASEKGRVLPLATSSSPSLIRPYSLNLPIISS